MIGVMARGRPHLANPWGPVMCDSLTGGPLQDNPEKLAVARPRWSLCSNW
jgi:hypothetical protein